MEPIKRKRTRKAECHKSGTFKYFVYYDDKKYNVCKLAFMSIHDISKTRVKFAYEKNYIRRYRKGQKREKSQS